MVALIAAALAAIPAVAACGLNGAEGSVLHNSSQAQEARTAPDQPSPVAEADRSEEDRPAIDELGDVKYQEQGEGAQATVIDLETGKITGTANHRFARPALSLIKLYLAYYVLEEGEAEDAPAATEMISDSSDHTADELAQKYPEAIETVAQDFALSATRPGDRWGTSTTSTYDVAKFVATLKSEKPTHPILKAMSSAATVAEDGYKQDFGTSVLPGAIGTKWAWSDGRELHSSVSFGENWVAAAAVTGDADDLSDFVEAQLADDVD